MSTPPVSKRPHDTPFKQQRLKAWQPILTPVCVITTFFIIAAVFLAIGSAILVASASVIDAGPFRYDDDMPNSPTFVTFNWPETTTENVYVYYQLTNFYQNHRRYVKSRSDQQLAGDSLSDKQTLGYCDPWEYFSDHSPNDYPADLQGKTPNQIVLNPCGLIANSQFNDTLSLYSGVCTNSSQCTSTLQVGWTKDGIAWKSDVEKKFKNLDTYTGVSTIYQQKNETDEDFIVWMRTAALPTFKKLYRIIPGGLAKGQYTMAISQRFNVSAFDGRKSFYLSTTSWIGGKNDFLGWAYISVGALCLTLCVLFFLKNFFDPRSQTDPSQKKH